MPYDIDSYQGFEDELTNTFPEMFSRPYGCIGVGEGWWPIIKTLCRTIQDHIDWKNSQKEMFGEGEGCAQVYVTRIKEKFGELRFYYNGGDAAVDGMVKMAEAWANTVCEHCGRSGKLRKGGWVKTLCDEHDLERRRQVMARFRHED